MNIKKCWWFFKCALGFGSVYDGSICWFSAKYWDVHDYHKFSGGCGDPMHFHDYKCTKCNKDFGI